LSLKTAVLALVAAAAFLGAALIAVPSMSYRWGAAMDYVIGALWTPAP
jgi:hypothetical protein